jgi:hypothetical protein
MSTSRKHRQSKLLEIGQELANEIAKGVTDIAPEHAQQRICTQAWLVTKETVILDDGSEFTDVNWLKALDQAEEQQEFLANRAFQEWEDGDWYPDD